MTQYLPTALTISRAVLGVVVVGLVAADWWAFAFWAFIAALITDFLDGWAARAFKVSTRYGAVLDAHADAALVGCGLIALTMAGIVPLWLVLLVAVIGGLFGSEWVYWPKNKRLAAARRLTAVSMLFIAWTTIAWLLAREAFGWQVWYVYVTILILVLLAILKRGRIRTWLSGEG